MLHTLSRQKHIQDELFKEIVSVFGTDKNTPVTHRQLNDLKYMDLVIKETLRFYPSVPAIGRYVDQDINLGKRKFIQLRYETRLVNSSLKLYFR